MPLNKAEKLDVVKEFSDSETNTGSSEVQIAHMSKRIVYLTEHLKIQKKDHSSRLGLLKIVSSRKRLLKYLKKTNMASYRTTIERLGIRDNIK